MSASILYRVFKTRVHSLASYGNGSGTAPVIWGYLGMKYLGWPTSYWGGQDMKLLWNLSVRSIVPRELRLVHAFTYDYAVVLETETNLKELGEACLNFDRLVQSWKEWENCVNHWGIIGHALLNLKPNSRSQGIGLTCTTVSDGWSEGPRYYKDKIFDCIAEVNRV